MLLALVLLFSEAFEGSGDGFMEDGDEFFVHEGVVVVDVQDLDGWERIEVGEHDFEAGRVFALHREDEISPEEILLAHTARAGLAETGRANLHAAILTEHTFGGRAAALVASADEKDLEAGVHKRVVAGCDAGRKL